MAIRIGCCLNLPAPTPTNSSSFPPKTSQLPISVMNKKSGGERPQKLPCAIIIGLELAIITVTANPSINYAAETQYDVVTASVAAETTHSRPPRTRQAPPPKWSDTIRSCPAWRVNSLESIVPENLPRPSAPAPRRTKAAGYSARAQEAQAIQKATAGGCFFM